MSERRAKLVWAIPSVSRLDRRSISEIKMKAKSKSQLAEMAGVSVDTLREWMKPFRQDLEAMGLRQNARVLPPNIVKFLAEKLCIDVED